MSDDPEQFEEWSVWRDYEDLTVCIQKEGKHELHLMPDEIRAKIDAVEREAKKKGIALDEQTKAMHETIREYAEEIEQLRTEKSQ
ncbi:MAG TPA: hypothetical protein VLA12_23415 [Planctomycetaceae bacterium]|nr:hypothetical protein [Planctomycetaceae bacterium]